MNPQAAPQPTTGQPDANLTPQPRPETQLNVPTRPIHDYDESAFSVDNTTPPLPPRTVPAPPPRPVVPPVPQRPPHLQPVAAPAPQPAVISVTPPQAPQLAPAAPIQPTLPAALPRTPLPPVATMPAPTVQPVAANPVPAAPQPAAAAPAAPSAPAQPAVTLQPSVPAAIPPMPITAVEPHSAAATPPPTPTVTFEPAPPPNPSPGPHTDNALIERIDETPQQNSRDIEELIEKNHRLRRLKGVASFVAFAVSVVIAAFLINQFVFQSYYVDGTSMVPTLHNDDRLIIDKTARTFAGIQGKPYIPERGQIVVLDSSIVGFNGREEQLIKRVVGVPGDTVIIQDGTVTIKNKENPDGFNFNQKFGLDLQPAYVESPQEWVIDDNHLFVMGDNRAQNGSYDSRAFGPVESNKIVGKLWVRILPFDKAQVY